MKSGIFTLVVAMFYAVPVFAFDSTPAPKGTGSNFEQHRAEILRRIDSRILRNQEEKSCVQAARNHDDIKACREKFKEEIREQGHKN